MIRLDLDQLADAAAAITAAWVWDLGDALWELQIEEAVATMYRGFEEAVFSNNPFLEIFK